MRSMCSAAYPDPCQNPGCGSSATARSAGRGRSDLGKAGLDTSCTVCRPSRSSQVLTQHSAGLAALVRVGKAGRSRCRPTHLLTASKLRRYHCGNARRTSQKILDSDPGDSRLALGGATSQRPNRREGPGSRRRYRRPHSTTRATTRGAREDLPAPDPRAPRAAHRARGSGRGVTAAERQRAGGTARRGGRAVRR